MNWKRRPALKGLALALLLGPVAAQEKPLPDDWAKARTEMVAGDYRLLTLSIPSGWPDTKGKPVLPFTLLVGFRDAEPVSVWAHGVSSGLAVVHLRGRQARLGKDSIKGSLDLVFGDGSTGPDTQSLTLDLNLTLANGKAEGSISVGGARAEAAGALMSADEFVKTNAFSPGKDWPGWWGVDFSMRGPDSHGIEWVDSFAEAGPVWRSEAALPVCYGSAADFRYAWRAAAQGTCGGASSPVVAGGRVFSHHYQPAGEVDGKSLEQWMAKSPRPFADFADFQQDWLCDLFRASADDVVIAIDAATGRTMWRTVIPLRGLNLQTHKHRGVSPTPLAAGGSLYVVNYLGRVYCLDQASGELRWEYPGAPEKPYVGKVGQAGSSDVPVGCASPVLIGGTLALTLRDETIGLDAASGVLRWNAKTGHDAELRAFGDQFFAIGIEPSENKSARNRTIVTALHPETGAQLWRSEVEIDRAYRLPIFAGDLLIGYRIGAKSPNNEGDGSDNSLLAYRIDPAGKGLALAWRLGGLPAITDSYGLAAHGGYAYLSGKDQVWAVSIDSGAVVAKIPGTGGARTQLMWTAENRLFLCPEGRHGACWITMFTAEGKSTRLTGAEGSPHQEWRGAWPVPNPQTTAYANHQIVHPVVDGRIFIRGADGIYCYDLRKR